MTTSLGCERRVVEKLISVFVRALNCQLSADSFEGSSDDISVAQKILKVLATLNDTLINGFKVSDDASNAIYENSTNATDVFMIFQESAPSGDGSNIITSSLGDDSSSSVRGISDGGVGEPFGTNKLHKLEIIKVFVLIFVISIILLTTCRMVFQLFVRFRPEKPPLA